MRYNHVIEGTFIDRPNRFIAHVLVDGKTEIVHVKNTGRCRELLVPGCTVYLTGSAAMDDYREGWSDLDLLILTPDGLTEDAAEALLHLRQRMTEAEPGNSFYRKIEGGAVPADAFFKISIVFASFCPTGIVLYYNNFNHCIVSTERLQFFFRISLQVPSVSV